MNIKKIAITAIFLLLSFSVNAENASNWLKPFSSWGNELGSTLYIDNVSQNGLIKGSYINMAQGTHCKNKTYPVTGWVYGDEVTFSVKWENPAESCQSVTGWTGYYSEGKITTKWFLAYGKMIEKGKDVFTQIFPIINKSLIQK